MSLIIKKNQKNNIFVTVTEKTTVSPAHYLMSLYSNDNHSTKVIRLSGDTSVNTVRWNQFVIEEVPVADEEYEEAKINLIQGGTYDYVIWQTTEATGTSINNLTSVESGLLRVSSGPISAITYNNSNQIITFK
jgi:hypothetical protein